MVKKYFSGFTLVELLIVVALLAILSAITIAYFTGQIFKGNDAKRKADVNRIQVAVEEYEKDHNCYPKYIDYCGANSGSSEIYPYLNNIPCDPVKNVPFVYIYDTSNPDCPGWYKIYSILQNTQDGSVIPNIGPNKAFNYVQGSPNAPIDIAGITQTTTPTGTSGGNSGGSNFYGCINGSCQPIGWDSSIPGPECDPNYQNPTCYGVCGVSGNQCIAVH